MRLQFRDTQLKLDALMPLLAAVGAALGYGTEMLAMAIALSAHELAHWAAARACGVGIASIRLTPFGGLSQMENPYLLTPGRLMLIAAAGPCANLLALVVSAALCHWNLLPPEVCAELLSANAVLMLFNLLPALPLDGGRMLFGMLTLFLPRKTALNAGIWSGRALAMLLILASVAGAALHHHLNLSLPAAAVFILASAGDERRALNNSRAETLLNALRPIPHPTRVDVLAIDESLPAHDALRAAVPGKVTLYAVYSGDRLIQLIDQRALLRRALEKEP